MMKVLQEFFSKEVKIEGILENYYAGVMVALTIGLVTLASKQIRAKSYTFLLNHLGYKIANSVKLLINLLFNPFFRLILIGILLYLVTNDNNEIIFSIIIFLLSTSFFIKRKESKLFPPHPIYSSGFHDEDEFRGNWTIRTGNPTIDKSFGKPAPDLELKYDPSQATSSLIFLKNIDQINGIIELDFNLENHGILNIIFFAKSDENKWYMARYDSRIGFSDGFLIKDQGPGANWREYIMSGTNTNPREWHRAKIEFDEHEARMYRNDILIGVMDNPNLFGSEVGLFNEVNDVHVDNFSVSHKPFLSKKKAS